MNEQDLKLECLKLSKPYSTSFDQLLEYADELYCFCNGILSRREALKSKNQMNKKYAVYQIVDINRNSQVLINHDLESYKVAIEVINSYTRGNFTIQEHYSE